jgi:DNA polymerase III subunit gamma/tau
MSLDTKYRPMAYSDVLGQDATIKVLKEIVRKRVGFHQSYVFGGAHGSGKTTLGRILARALLCDIPQDGEPCDACSSCKAVLAGTSESFIEIDAATNSGKDDIRRITEDASFGSFSGKRKLYLFDESHELSRQAMDALLKPLEDNIPRTQEKQIVCIFCTTEPEKMRPAILSRCAPAFRIRLNTPEDIAVRLSYICERENIEYSREALLLIAEATECHIRDAIKAVEGVSMLGEVSLQNSESYLHLDGNNLLIAVLENLGTDLNRALHSVETLLQGSSPSSCYAKLADLSIMAYRLANLGDYLVPSFWDKDRVSRLGAKHGDFLLQVAEKLSSRPLRATSSMLQCDISALHLYRKGSTLSAPPITNSPNAPNSEPNLFFEDSDSSSFKTNPAPIEGLPKDCSKTKQNQPQNMEVNDKTVEPRGNIPKVPVVTEMGVHIDPIAQNTRRSIDKTVTASPNSRDLSSDEFTRILRRRVLELTEEKATSGRPARWTNLGNP